MMHLRWCLSKVEELLRSMGLSDRHCEFAHKWGQGTGVDGKMLCKALEKPIEKFLEFWQSGLEMNSADKEILKLAYVRMKIAVAAVAAAAAKYTHVHTHAEDAQSWSNECRAGRNAECDQGPR
eukprot:SAG31_NODE_3238_length_4507_cov_14.674682_2_plen_123_part_00